MKWTLIFLATPFIAMAQSVDVKDVDAADSESTTIEIRKGKKAEENRSNKWEVSEGTADIEGEPGATAKEANKNWDTACKEWKKEFKAENKENGNIVITTDCGSKSKVCGGEVGNKTCSSSASYKIKTPIN